MQLISNIKSSDLIKKSIRTDNYDIRELIKIFYTAFPVLNHYSLKKDYKLLFKDFKDLIKYSGESCDLKQFYELSVEFEKNNK